MLYNKINFIRTKKLQKQGTDINKERLQNRKNSISNARKNKVYILINSEN